MKNINYYNKLFNSILTHLLTGESYGFDKSWKIAEIVDIEYGDFYMNPNNTCDFYCDINVRYGLEASSLEDAFYKISLYGTFFKINTLNKIYVPETLIKGMIDGVFLSELMGPKLSLFMDYIIKSGYGPKEDDLPIVFYRYINNDL